MSLFDGHGGGRCVDSHFALLVLIFTEMDGVGCVDDSQLSLLNIRSLVGSPNS
jgi:hypothetical protein